MRTRDGFALFLLLFSIHLTVSSASRPSDQFLEGYAAAVLDMRFGLKALKPRVQNGTIYLDPVRLEGRNPKEVAGALRSIEGLQVAAGPDKRPPTIEPPGKPATVAESEGARRATGWLPPAKVFDPLIADPRWPRFSASIQFYQDDPRLDTVGSANFGATIPFYGWESWGAQWQVGLQAGVFSIFNMDAPSTDLVNADYFVALPVSVRSGQLSAQVRVFHQSSHLGDEYLLRNPVNRINLSYEGGDLLLSWDVDQVFRFYGGGGGLFHTDPENLKPWFVHGGFQLTSPSPLFTEQVYPIAALDVQANEQEDWNVDFSVRAGLDFRSEWLAGRRLQWLFEYFNGNSPNGQFFQREIEYFGTGLHFFF